ncbi:MAG: acetyl-CoA carboxylase biotin carboxyl carrier protein subunit, partial [Pikeienuella sp.]
GAAWSRRDGFRLWSSARALVRLDDSLLRVDIAGDDFTVADEESSVVLTVRRAGDGLRVAHDGRVFDARAIRHRDRITVFMDGAAHEFAAPDPLAVGDAAAAGGDMVLSPMPGLVKAMNAAPGMAVSQGQALCVLEAMKMEHSLKAPRDGVIASIGAEAGDQVEEGAVLVKLEPAES